MTNSPPGWYFNSEGEKQWWDGEKWGVLETQFNALYKPEVPARKKGLSVGKFIVLVLAVTAVLALVLAGMSGLGNSTPSTKTSPSAEATDQEAAPEPEPTQEPAPQPALSAAEQQDQSMTDQGWATVVSGDTYYRFLTDEEKANSSCGSWTCVWVVVVSMSGCPSGFYVKADILSGETPVSWTNEISASAQPGESVVVQLNDVRGVGNVFRVSELNCMG